MNYPIYPPLPRRSREINDQRRKTMREFTIVLTAMLLTCDLSLNSALGASAINTESDKKPQQQQQTTITEYYKDHEVSEKTARESLRVMTEVDFQPPPHCAECTAEQKQYCQSRELLKDHCCCNQSHRKGKTHAATPQR
jgi:hypothetical protein